MTDDRKAVDEDTRGKLERERASHSAVRRRRKIRYKGGVDEAGNPKPPGIQYHGGNLDLSPGGVRVPWRESQDNPMSPSFIPLTERNERAKSRWWALYNKRNARPSHGVFDP